MLWESSYVCNSCGSSVLNNKIMEDIIRMTMHTNPPKYGPACSHLS